MKIRHTFSVPIFAALLMLLAGGLGLGTVHAQEIYTNTVYDSATVDGELVEYKHSEYTYYLSNDVEVKHGLYEEWWDPDGTLRYRMHYSDGERHGEYEEWNSTGLLFLRENYFHGKLHGEVVRWNWDGTLWFKRNYHHGELHGESSTWDGDGEIRAQDLYRYGLLHGKQFWRWSDEHVDRVYVDGRLLLSREYVIVNNVMSLVLHEVYDLSRPSDTELPVFKEEFTYWSSEPDKLLWRVVTWKSQETPDGNDFYYWFKEEKEHDSNGQWIKSSEWINYIEPSPVRGEIGWLEEGTTRDFSRYYDQLTESEYVEGQLHGIRRVFRYDREIIESHYYRGQPSGRYRDWNVAGVLKWEFHRHLGKKHGREREWNDAGVLTLDASYHLGKKHGEIRGWNDDGVLTSQTSYYLGKWHGERREWLPDGRIRNITYYSNGERCATEYRYLYADIDYVDEDRIRTTDYGPCAPWAGEAPEDLEPPEDMEPADPSLDPPEDVGTPAEPNKSIAGRVRCGSSGTALAGVAVSAGSESTTTDARGHYQLSVGNLNSVALSFSKDGYRSRGGSVSLSGSQRRMLNVSLLREADESAVMDVISKYGSIFLEGLPVHNEYTALVDWGESDPGSVVFERNDTEHAVDGTSSGAAMTFNMGSDFNPTFNPHGNRLAVHAVNVAGERSAHSFHLNPVVIPLPPWSLSLGLFDVEQSGDAYKYKLDASFPSEPMAIEVSPEALGSTLWAAWGFVPVVGGQKFGIPPSQLKFEVAVSTEGSGSIDASAVMGFQAAGAEIETTLGGKGDVAYDMVGQEGLSFKGAELRGGVKGTAKREFGPVELIPNLAGAVNLPILGRPISWFNRRAKIDATIMLGGELKFVLVDEGEGVVFDRSEGALSGGIGLGMGGDIGSLKARVSGGGETKLTYQLPPDPNYLKSVESEVEAKLELALWSYETEFSAKGSMTYPSASGSSVPLRASTTDSTPVTRLMNTDFVDQEPYQVFRGGSSMRTMSATSAQGTVVDIMSAGEEPFISNVFPYAEPALATFGAEAALAYVAYDPEQPVTQGNELWVAFQNGGDWNPPTRVTDDSHNDYAPSLAYASDGKLVMIWERVRPAAFTGDSPEALAPHLEIAYSVYDPMASSWSAPTFLSDNTWLDFAPYLAASPDGELKAFWLHNPGSQLIGDADNPIRLYSATWNGSGFDAPVIHPYGFQDAWDFRFAYDGERARVAWIQDADGDVTTLEDQQPYYSIFDGLAWGSPVALLPDASVPAGSPVLLCIGPDQWELFWQRGDQLVRLTDWGTQAIETVREDSGGFAFANFNVSRSADGRILLIWQGMGESSPDLFCRVYDVEHGVWSEDLRLTQQAGQEAALAGNLHVDGTLRLFFTRARVDGSDATDLLYIERQLASRLVADRERFDLTPAMPKLEEAMSLTAYVRNAGERALANLVAAFYLGDPADGGVLIESVAVAPTIVPAGAEGTATLADWTVPGNIGLESVFVVFTSPETPLQNDPAEHVAVLSPVWVDLAVSQIEVGEPAYGGDIDILATIANHGNAIAPDVQVQLLLDGMLYQSTRLPALLPGLTAQVGFTVVGNTFNSTRTTVGVVADPDRLLPDIEWDNNRHEVVVNRVVGVSSMDDGMDDDWKFRYFGHLTVDPDGDPDGDGVTNLQEFLTGTDPLDPDSFFSLKPERLDAFGTIKLEWPARAAQRYRVEISYDLEHWTPLPFEHTAFQDGHLSMFETTGTTTNRAFYRVRLIE